MSFKTKLPPKSFGKSNPAQSKGLKRGFFDGIETARPRTKNPMLQTPGDYLCEVKDAKYFLSEDPKKKGQPTFVLELEVVRSDVEGTEGKRFSVIQTEGGYPESFLGFINGFVAAAAGVGNDEVSAEMAEQYLTMPDDDGNAGPPGEAVGKPVSVSVTESYKRNKQTGQMELSDFPNYTFSAYAEE